MSVMNPAWLPVKLAAARPWSCSAMAISAMALRSPAVISMSISRPGRERATSPARRSRSSVSFPIAETTRTTWLPWRTERATLSATWRMRSASPTDVPPNFWTTRAPSCATGLRSYRSRQPVPLPDRMGSVKRARQKANRQARLQAAVAAQQRAKKKRQYLRIGVIAASWWR